MKKTFGLVIAAFLLLICALLVASGCADPSSYHAPYDDGAKCVRDGRQPVECYAMCSAQFASKYGDSVRDCANGVSSALK